MQRQTILLVDDDSNIRAFAQLLLERAGYRVLTAADGADGLRVFQIHRATIGLLLTDWRMPKMNGLDLADRVLQFDSTLPVLVMTGDGPTATSNHEYLEKPVAPAELLRRVGEALDATERFQRTKVSAVAC